MKNENNTESLFKNLASLYAEADGERLKREIEELDKLKTSPYPFYPDKKIKTEIRNLKLKQVCFVFVPAAACFLLVFMLLNQFLPLNQKDLISTIPAANSPESGIVFLSSTLPAGYEITGIDYDKEKTIYYMVNDKNNHIVLTMEISEKPIDSEALREIDINGVPVYGLVKNDFSFLTYVKDDILYMLTSQYNYEDLIAVSKCIL